MTIPAAPTLAEVLDGTTEPGDGLRPFNGFGGLQGGLVSAMLLRAARRQADPALTPVELSTHFFRPSTGQPAITAEPVHAGRAVSVVSAFAHSGGRPAALATAVLDAKREPWSRPVTPDPPTGLTPLDQAPRVLVPPDFVPISTRIEIRSAIPALPYSAALRPELCAWARLTDPLDDPVERLLILADALAPSYAAVLTELRPLPTIRMTVRFTPEASTADFDWVLIHAHTPEAGADSWLSETITLWTPDGHLLVSSSQLRTIR